MGKVKIASYDEHFSIVRRLKKGIVRQHYLVEETLKDYKLVRAIAIEKAKLGASVDIMPTLHEYDPLRNIVFPDAKGSTNADLRINGVLYEVEQPTKPKKINNLKHRISNGASQADYVIIDLIESVSLGHLVRVCKGRFIDHLDLKIIEFRFAEEFIVMKREDYFKKKRHS